MVTVKPEGAEPLSKLPRPDYVLHELKRTPFQRRLEALRTQRSFYDHEMGQIARFIRPRRWKRGTDKPGQRETGRMATDIINTTGVIASRTLKSGMQSGVSSPARPWFKLTTPGDPELAEHGEVKEYLTTVARIMATVFARSNIYNSLHQEYGDLGDFGTSCMMIDENFRDVIRCHVYSPGSFYLAADGEGKVTTVYREFPMTVLAMMQKWGDRCSPRVRQLYDAGNTEVYVDIVEAIEPNMDQVRGEKGVRGMPFIRVYFEAGSDSDTMLSVKGCHEFPGCTPRWDVSDEDVYGSGPGLDAINDVMGLQTLEVRKAILIDKLATPPTQGGHKTMQVNHRAGAHTFTGGAADANARVIHPLYDLRDGAVERIAQEIARHEQRIKEAYFSDLFLMFAQTDRREITAREVDERHEEKLLALGPVLERLGNENLDPAIERTFNIMDRVRFGNGEGMLPEPPEVLHGMDLKVQFIGMLAQAQRAVNVNGIEGLSRFVGGLATAYPDVLDKFDPDQAVDEFADAVGVPSSLVVSDDKVKTLRGEKAKAQQAAQAGAAMGQAAEIGKTLSQTELTPTSALAQIAGGIGAA